MLHNVTSYTNAAQNGHNLANCVHKHSGKMPETGMDIKMEDGSPKENLLQPDMKISMLEMLVTNLKKAWGNGVGILRGIWSESADSGNENSAAGVLRTEQGEQNGKISENAVASAAAMETLADIKIQNKLQEKQETKIGKMLGAIPALKVKTQQSRERWGARKDAFLKEMKKIAGKRRNPFEERKEERPGQQEKEMEWFEMSNEHLLDSYDKNGEYASLLDKKGGRGYSGSPVRENYSTKA